MATLLPHKTGISRAELVGSMSCYPVIADPSSGSYRVSTVAHWLFAGGAFDRHIPIGIVRLVRRHPQPSDRLAGEARLHWGLGIHPSTKCFLYVALITLRHR